jgi:glycosyltransferase involved in cell wall biosynthesis
MHAAFLQSSVSRLAGGLFMAPRALAQALHGRGVRMSVLGVHDAHSEEDRSAWDGLDLHLFSPLPPRALAYARRYRHGLNQLNPDLAHCHGLWQYPSMACSGWATRSKRPYLVSPHGMLDPWALTNARLKKQLAGAVFQRRHLQQAACLHALCESEAQAMRAYGLTHPICIVPNGVDLPEPGESLPPAWPVETDGRHVILFLGRLHPKKGLPHLLEGWRALLRDRPGIRHRWCIVIAGWDQGGHRAMLTKQAAALDISSSLFFTGPLHGDQKAAAFAHADAFVLPSFSEGMPAAILEAWSYGLPVIMTRHCNIPEGFAADAALAMTADATGAQHALACIVDQSDDERRLMGERGRALVQTRFTWSVIGEQMHRVYDWVLGGGAAPACVRE